MTISCLESQPHGFLCHVCVAKFYHQIVYTFMKDRFRSAVFYPTRNFVYLPSGKEKTSTWKMQASHCPVRNQAENQIPH